VLTDEQVNEFAERGFVLVPQVVKDDVLARTAQRVDEVVAADPPAAGKRGSHFYFLETRAEPALMAPLARTAAFSLAEELAGAATLEIPGQVQIALNIPPYSHRPGIPHIDAGNPEPTSEPVNGTFTLLAGILMTDQRTENSGNLWVWPGTHLAHAAYFRAWPLDADATKEFADLAAQSLEQQAKLEREEVGSFDAFVAAYRAYTLNRFSV